ncbi:hypothetical protein D046_2485A, partial [Vibrio parahaemolyticus V-223/04]
MLFSTLTAVSSLACKRKQGGMSDVTCFSSENRRRSDSRSKLASNSAREPMCAMSVFILITGYIKAQKSGL